MKSKFLLVTGITLGVSLLTVNLVNNQNHNNIDFINVKATDTKPIIEESQKVFQNNDSDKKELINLMINSINYFQNAQGEFDYYSANADTDMTITFAVDILNHKSYEKNVYNHLKTKDIVSPQEESLFDGENYSVMRNDDYIKAMLATDKTFKESDYLPFVTNKIEIPSQYLESSKSIETIDERLDEEQSYIRKMDVSLMGITKTALLPEDFAIGFMGTDYTKWDIVSNQEYLGRHCVEISTHFNDYYQNKHHGKEMNLLIDASTGVLLKASIKNNGKETFKVQMNQLSFNEVIDNQIFHQFDDRIKES